MKSLIRLVVFLFMCSVCATALSGCGDLITYQTKARSFTDELKTHLSAGDSRQKVHLTLGQPLIDGHDLGLEVYLQSGRDVIIGWLLVPWILIPGTDDKVIAAAMVVYDKNDLVTEIVTEAAEQGITYSLFKMNAHNYVFINSFNKEPPDTLLSPTTSWEDIRSQPPLNEQCQLMLVMDDCVMERVLLDKVEIADLSPGSLTSQDSNLNATFVRREISAGRHHLQVHQKSWRGTFDADFECAPGDMVYVELEARLVTDWWSKHFEGTIAISRQAPEMGSRANRLRQVLWHKGKWY